MPEYNLTPNEGKKFWFTGHLGMDPKFSIANCCIAMTVNYLVWEQKLKKRVPAFRTLMVEFFYIIGALIDNSGEFRDSWNGNNFLLCRDWLRLREEHG